MWEIRAATRNEAARLGEVAERIFRDTFAPFNTEADMDMYCAEEMSETTFASAIADPLSEILVAVEGEEIVAYAHLHRSPSPAAPDDEAIELKRFYVLRDRHGSGLARDLMRAVAERAAELGATTLWLGVWERNERAIAFYRKLGFEEAGELRFILGTDLQRDLLMTVPMATLLASVGASATGARETDR